MDSDLSYIYPERNTELICTHCGETVEEDIAIFADKEVYCCNGCLGIRKLIHSLGLEDYYEIRNTDKHKSKNYSDISEQYENFSYLNQSNFRTIYTDPKAPNKIKFYIEGIQCTGCLWLIENLANTTEEIGSVELNMSSNIATVEFLNDASIFPGLVQSLGYKAHPVRSDNKSSPLELNENKTHLYRIGIAGFCAGNIMLLSAAIYAGANNFYKELFQILNAVLLLPIVTYCSYPFYNNVLNSLKYRKANVDIAVVFIIITGSVLSVINLFYGGETYFDSVAAFVFLLLLSRHVLRYVQKILSKKSGEGDFVFRESSILKWEESSGQYFLTPQSEIQKGDRVRLRKGDTIPFDGSALSSSSYIDVSVVTGENYPKHVGSGDKVYAGSVLESDFLTLKVNNTGFDTRIGKILKKIELGSFVNKNLSAFTDRYSTIFTISVALISIVFFSYFTYVLSFSDSISRTISFVLVSCPCAFIFVLPLTYSYSIKSGFNKGFIIKDIGVFDKIRKTKNIFFDKTGTLTNGRFRILEWDLRNLSRHELSEISAIQSKSEHPIAKAITRHISNNIQKAPVVEEYGKLNKSGIYGVVNGNRYEFVNEPANNINDINQFILTRISIRLNGEEVSEILFGDTLRQEAKLTVNRVKSLGIRPLILSGDRYDNVTSIATNLDIPEHDIYAEQTPEEKISVLESHSNSIMIGDGLNDSGALACADIGIAIQGSVDESLGASDVFLMRRQLTTILDIISHGKSTSQIIRNTVFVSVLYNISAGAFALMGFITPLAAAVLMPTSSLILLAVSYLGHSRLKGGINC